MKYCEYCGKPMNDFASFCSGCGRRCQEAETTYCENCGQPLAAGAQFCVRCGTPVQPVLEKPVSKKPITEPELPGFVKQKQQQPVLDLPSEDDYPASQRTRQQVTENTRFGQRGNDAATETPPAPKKVKKLRRVRVIIAAATVIAVVTGIVIFFLSGGLTTQADSPDMSDTYTAQTDIPDEPDASIVRAEFPDMITTASVNEVMNAVMTNTLGNYTFNVKGNPFLFEGYDINCGHSDGLESKYQVQLDLADRSDHIYLHTSTGGAQSGTAFGNYTQEQYEDAVDIIVALEKTLTGKNRAEEFLKSYVEMQNEAKFLKDSISETYWLNDQAEVTITIENLNTVWSVSYSIRIYH